MEGIYTLSDVKEYLKDNSFTISDERVKKCYDYIYAPYSRVNDEDKKWIAYSTQEYEKEAAIKAIKKILDHSSIKYTAETIIGHITNKVDEVGKLFETKKITHKSRIPFYVLVLHKLLS